MSRNVALSSLLLAGVMLVALALSTPSEFSAQAAPRLQATATAGVTTTATLAATTAPAATTAATAAATAGTTATATSPGSLPTTSDGSPSLWPMALLGLILLGAGTLAFGFARRNR